MEPRELPLEPEEAPADPPLRRGGADLVELLAGGLRAAELPDVRTGGRLPADDLLELLAGLRTADDPLDPPDRRAALEPDDVLAVDRVAAFAGDLLVSVGLVLVVALEPLDVEARLGVARMAVRLPDCVVGTRALPVDRDTGAARRPADVSGLPDVAVARRAGLSSDRAGNVAVLPRRTADVSVPDVEDALLRRAAVAERLETCGVARRASPAPDVVAGLRRALVEPVARRAVPVVVETADVARRAVVLEPLAPIVVRLADVVVAVAVVALRPLDTTPLPTVVRRFPVANTCRPAGRCLPLLADANVVRTRFR